MQTVSQAAENRRRATRAKIVEAARRLFGQLGYHNTQVMDIVHAVDVAFRDQDPVTDPGCTLAQTDVNCDTVTDVVDVVHLINVAFRDGNPATEFGDPCAP